MKSIISVFLLFITQFGFLYGVRILVLGGSGFLGSETFLALSQRDYSIDLLTRGNNHFASDTRINWLASKHIICDRDELLRKNCKELLTSGYYDYVIDFSSFKPVQLDQMLDVLKNRVGIYVYVSTDAIYEVTMKEKQGLTKETDDKRPTNETILEELNKENKYGNNKLSCEELLKSQRQKGGFPYVIFRVADAIGPRDETMRFWIYDLWIKIHQDLKIKVSLPSPVQNHPFSLAYSKDLSRAIENIVDGQVEVLDQTINIAFEEPITLKSLLEEIGKCHQITEINFDHDVDTAWYRFPTTFKGPLDISFAKENLGDWAPTKFEDAVKEICSFYADAIHDDDYRREREILLASFMDDVLPNESNEDDFIETLQQVYGPGVLDDIDLGFDVDLTQPRIPKPTDSSISKEEL